MSDNQMVCTLCGFIGQQKSKVKGSIFIEIILWFFFLIPGLIYSIWRLMSKEKVCPKCGHATMIPTSTPQGQKLVPAVDKTIK